MHESLVHLLESSCSKFKDRPLFGRKAARVWDWMSYGVFFDAVKACSSGLAARGIGPTDRVAIISDNSVEWATAAYATYGRRAAFVPMYMAQRSEEWTYILQDSGAKVVFAADARAYEAAVAAKKSVTTLEHVIGIHLEGSHPDSFTALLSQGRKSPAALLHPTRDDVASFIYTAGTTGQPKGVVLSHLNQCSNCDAVARVLPLGGLRSLAFLPWAHIFGQTAELHYFIHEGGSMALNDDVSRLVENLAEVKPTALVAVPRVFNRIHERVVRQMSLAPKPVQKLFHAGLAISAKKLEGKALSLPETLALRLVDKLLFSKVRARFGGRLKLVISGSAALSPEVARFIAALGIPIYEGYGLSEASPVISVNYPGHSRAGSVGKPLPGVTVELDLSRGDQPGEGEIVVKGPNVMRGYHNLPAETAAAIREDGALRTGDLGRLDPDGFLYITGRLKELYKLENGKYVAPAALEEALKLSPSIGQIVLYGANHAYNVALVVPDMTGLEEWAKRSGITLGDVTKNPEVNKHLMAEIQKFGADAKSYERPRKIAIITEDFTTDNGLLTPKMSVRRGRVIDRYKDLLESLY